MWAPMSWGIRGNKAMRYYVCDVKGIYSGPGEDTKCGVYLISFWFIE